MASIRCKACGRRYSYHASDLCPHCGAYNRPQSRMRVDFDADGNAELLNEQQFRQQSAANRRNKVCYETETESRDTESTFGRPAVKREVLGGFCAMLIAVLVLLNLGVRYVVRIENVTAPEPDISALPTEGSTMPMYGVGETFTVDDRPVTVEEVTFEEGKLLVLVQWDNEARWLPELSVITAAAEAVSDPLCEEVIGENLSESLYRYTYCVEDIDWQNTIDAQLLFSSWEGSDDAWVDITVQLFHAVNGA